MKILLDKSTPQRLGLPIEATHTLIMTSFQGCSSLKNGDLLNAAEDAGFELFSTANQELSYLQKLTSRRIAMLVLSTNNGDSFKATMDEIMAAINASTPGTFVSVEIGAHLGSDRVARARSGSDPVSSGSGGRCGLRWRSPVPARTRR